MAVGKPGSWLKFQNWFSFVSPEWSIKIALEWYRSFTIEIKTKPQQASKLSKSTSPLRKAKLITYFTVIQFHKLALAEASKAHRGLHTCTECINGKVRH